jgi:hypothetical protein
MSEEVIESVYAGRNINKRAFDASYRQKTELPSPTTHSELPLTVITDIRYHPSWKFEIDAGAWRRILMNIFNNAVKYTEKGFVQVSLDVVDEEKAGSGRPKSLLILKVKDSGKGISQEFLKHGLFKPFSQEDSLAAGAGLGLSIVRRIIHDLGGDINIMSEPGVGTEAVVRIPLGYSPLVTPEVPEFLSEARKETEGLRFYLEGFDRYPDLSETPTGLLSAEIESAMFLKQSLHNLLVEWYCMNPIASADKSSTDLVVIMDPAFGGTSIEDVLKGYEAQSPADSRRSTALVLLSAYPSTPRPSTIGRFNIVYVPQP